VREFAGRFLEGVAKPRNVTVTLFYNKANEASWVFVREVTRP